MFCLSHQLVILILNLVLNPCYKFEFFEGMDFGKALIDNYKASFRKEFIEYAKWYLKEQDQFVTKSPSKRQLEDPSSSTKKKTLLNWEKIKPKSKNVASLETLEERAESMANSELHNYLEGNSFY
jgi:hypothetical protein